jgi:hypothetical protein
MIAYLILPVWLLSNPETGEYYQLSAILMKHRLPESNQMDIIYYPYGIAGILAVLSIVIAIVEIFKFKNRLTQIKLGLLNSIVITASLLTLVILSYYDQQELMPDIRGVYQTGLFLPAAALIFNSLANRYIRKDEKLVRSVDRIR